MKKQLLLFLSFLFTYGCSSNSDSNNNNNNNNNTNSVTDVDGNVYQKVTICDQTWTQSNLNVSKYSDGTTIPQVTDPVEWANITTGAWCYTYNDPANGAIYGKLYNWYAVAGIYDAASLDNPELRKKLAPNGWHIPTNQEWVELTNCLGGYAIAGAKMKEIGTLHWTSPNTGANNSSGFTAIPAGYRRGSVPSNPSFSGSFTFINDYGGWWSITENVNTTDARNIYLKYNANIATHYTFTKKHGFSVRCLKD